MPRIRERLDLLCIYHANNDYGIMFTSRLNHMYHGNIDKQECVQWRKSKVMRKNLKTYYNRNDKRNLKSEN